MSGGWGYRPSWGQGEDFVHTQMREYWLATGQLTAEQAGQPVDADGFRNLGFLASWGYTPEAAETTVSAAQWGGPWVPLAWSQSWVEPSTESSMTTSWMAGWA